MNFEVGRRDGSVALRRRGVLSVKSLFELPAAMPEVDVLYCMHCRAIPDPAYERYVEYVEGEEHTLLCDLSKSEEQLFKQMSASTRTVIRRAETNDSLVFKAYSPQDLSRSNDILLEFADFYDGFARSRGRPPLRRDDLLAQARAGLLWLTTAQKDGEALVLRCYHAARGRARLWFTCSHFRQQESDRRNLIGRAHRWLIWQDMRKFRSNAFTTYDLGSWYAGTADKALLNINRFKEGFGGEKTRLYTLAIPLSLRGRAYLPALSIYKRSTAIVYVVSAFYQLYTTTKLITSVRRREP